MTGKLLYQSVVRLKTGWDDTLHQYKDVLDKWDDWLQELELCKDVIITRSILPTEINDGNSWKCEVVGCSDGNSLGYGCALYLR